MKLSMAQIYVWLNSMVFLSLHIILKEIKSVSKEIISTVDRIMLILKTVKEKNTYAVARSFTEVQNHTQYPDSILPFSQNEITMKHVHIESSREFVMRFDFKM